MKPTSSILRASRIALIQGLRQFGVSYEVDGKVIIVGNLRAHVVGAGVLRIEDDSNGDQWLISVDEFIVGI